MKLKTIFILLILSSCYISDEVAPDQEIWDYELPGKNGLSENILLGLDNSIKVGAFQEIHGMIIIKNDHLIFENYYFGRKRSSIQNIGNAGLTFTLAAVGVAEDKRILSLNDSIADYLPEYAYVFTADPNKQAITIEHLLTHKSGFSWNESIQPFSLTNDLNVMKTTDDWVRYILEQPMEAPAGLRTNLNTGSGVLLAKIIEAAAGQSFDQFLLENILNPLTIATCSIDTDPAGNFNGGDGISVSLLDWTKLGYLYLSEGIWQNRKIIDPNFVLDAASIQTEVSGLYNLGYIWQFFGEDLSGYFGIPHDEFYYIPGELGQHIYIIPSENMIVSIFAENYFAGFFNPSLNLFTEITNSFQ
ncbi:MAG: serine hydrolase [Ekhidna sp.]|uniref:serine hydrolase domain-containing protein n=1 Tax=Ekhidna sp. TaxID=2608089 RepID=UPI0032ED84B4